MTNWFTVSSPAAFVVTPVEKLPTAAAGPSSIETGPVPDRRETSAVRFVTPGAT